MTNPDMTTIRLADARPGSHLILDSINAGTRLKERLLSMGFPIGHTFFVQHNNRGSVVIGSDSNRVAIGKGMAMKLLVSQVA